MDSVHVTPRRQPNIGCPRGAPADARGCERLLVCAARGSSADASANPVKIQHNASQRLEICTPRHKSYIWLKTMLRLEGGRTSALAELSSSVSVVASSPRRICGRQQHQALLA